MDQENVRLLPLARLVESWNRHTGGLLLHDAGGTRECVVRRGEILVPPAVLETATARLRRWADSVQTGGQLPFARVNLRPAERDRCVEIARDLAGEVPGVAPNNVQIGSMVMYGTGTRPRAVPDLPAPPRQEWQPRIIVGVLDTGLDPHPWFTDREWFDDREAVPELLDADGDSEQDRLAGHGTFVAGVLLQHAPGVVIRPQRVLSSLGFTDDLTVAAGLRALRRTAAARDEHLDAVVMTAGCHTADDACPPVLAAELRRFTGAVVVAAAGNQGTTRPFWPAASPEVLGVAATGTDGLLANFSNSGHWVDAAAPGVDVTSSYVHMTGERGTVPDARDYGCAEWSGTSFAAPRVAAAVAGARRDGHDADTAGKIARHRFPPMSSTTCRNT